MKGEITLKILEFVKDFANLNIDMFEAFLRAGYGASYGKLNYELNRIQQERWRQEIKSEEMKRYRKRYAQLLYQLKCDGLIKEKAQKDKKVILLTEKGKSKLSLLKEKYLKKLPSVNIYKKEIGDKFIITVFDIPEKERRKRAWLRSALKNIGLNAIQKSVWAGKVKIPKEFIDNLSDLRLLDFIEIFEISKTGSLRHLI